MCFNNNNGEGHANFDSEEFVLQVMWVVCSVGGRSFGRKRNYGVVLVSRKKVVAATFPGCGCLPPLASFCWVAHEKDCLHPSNRSIRASNELLDAVVCLNLLSLLTTCFFVEGQVYEGVVFVWFQ